ncbi:MAG: DUF4389 domain-containing protein [Dehalococcoidia bacterium]
MATYGATFDIDHQPSYDRTQVVIRILILIVLSILGGALGWLHGALYLAVPVLAAVLISQKGAQTYIAESGRTIKLWLAYLFAFYAYLGLLTDRLPGDDPQKVIRFDVTAAGEPTAGNVLLRIILAIPHAIVLALLGIIAFVLIVIAAVMILVNESYPEGIFNFLRGYLRWQVRLYAYLGGLVQEYPPFALDTGSEAPPASATPAGDGSQPQPTA